MENQKTINQEEHIRLIFNLHSASVELAKACIEEGMNTISEFAESAEEKINMKIKLAWNEANGGVPLMIEDFKEDSDYQLFISIQQEKIELSAKNDIYIEQIKHSKDLIQSGHEILKSIQNVLEGKSIEKFLTREIELEKTKNIKNKFEGKTTEEIRKICDDNINKAKEALRKTLEKNK